MKIYKKLTNIQCELKAKKGQFNAFGKYKYRSLEDIYESLKPLLQEHNCCLVINNDLEIVNNILFRKSTAKLIDNESGEHLDVHTYTQEAISKKGMSPEQCSGSTASYSDKYCLNKMFCIDDNKDPDTMDNSERKHKNETPPKETPPKKPIDPYETFKIEIAKKTSGWTDKDKVDEIREFLGIIEWPDVKNKSAETIKEMVEAVRGFKSSIETEAEG